MTIIDSKDSSLINGIIYFDDVSVKLFSTKVLTILSDSDNINVSITKGTSFGVFSYSNVSKEMFDEGFEYQGTSTTKVGDKWLHNVCIYAKSDVEETHISDIVFDNSITIKLQCEIIDEEDRFAVALSNNKFYINDTFLNAFRDSEIGEHFTDYKLLNEKRREMLLDLFSIKSFVGVYYGLINALKYFGYDDDVIIKEFWTYFDDQLKDYVLSRHDIETDVSRLPKGYAKTNMFSLTYKFNDITGDYDENDLPELMDTFFNDFEALVKMYNLRIILQTYFLPSHAIIVEIVGEHTSFYRSGIGYYIHQAMIHYYCTEVKSVYDYDFKDFHESRQVETYDIPKTGVIFGEYAVRLRKVFPNHSNENITDMMRFVDDNFAYVKLDFNQQYYDFMTSCKIVVVDDRNRTVLEIENEDIEDTIIIGFLRDQKYNIKTFCTDKYNLMHVYELKLETFFVKHNFEVFTVKNELNFIEPEKKTKFPSTKEAFEYFKWRNENIKFNNDVTQTEYSGLPILHAYGSHFSNSGIQNWWQYKDGQFPNLNDMINNLRPYRLVTENMAYVNEFDINNEKHSGVPSILYKSLNKAYAIVFQELTNGSNTVEGTIDNKVGKFDFFANLNSDYLVVENSIVKQFYSQKETPSENRLGALTDFDCYVYNVYDAQSKVVKPYVMLFSKKPFDITENKFVFPNAEVQFKNLVSHSGAFAYGNVYENMEIGLNIELSLTDEKKLYYRRSPVVMDSIDVLITEMTQLFAQYEILNKFQIIKLDERSFFINGDKSFVIRVGENLLFGGSKHDHLVNDLIKIDSGTDTMQYSIVFAKIDETAVTRPYDITWRLYENSGNDTNLIKTSNNYFFSEVLLDKTSYTLELEYYDKANILESDIEAIEHFKKVVVKKGVFLTKNNYFDTLFEKFKLSQYENR